jgi:hypothetical protein
MKRTWTALAMTVALLGCGPENQPRRCEGKADFLLVLDSPNDSFPNDTQIQVTFGGGSTETYWLSAANDPEVLFCEITPAGRQSGGGAGGADGGASSEWTGGFTHGGAGGALGTSAIRSITCEIWSAGPATVTIRAASWHTVRELKADPEICTLRESIVLGEPDPKP